MTVGNSLRLAGALIALVIACGCARPPSPPPAPAAPVVRPPAGVLTIGSVSLNPALEHEVVQPFADYLAARLGGLGIGAGRVMVVDSLHTMAEALASGRVDLYLDSPFPVAFVARRSDAVRVLLRRWKRGADSYRSIIFARADSGAETLEDLRGRMVAFGAPFSTSAFLLPKALMVSQGLSALGYQDASAPVAPQRIGYVFSNDAENTMFWVLKGKVTAGAVNEDYFAELAGERMGELRVLARSAVVPRNLVCSRSDLDPALSAAIVDLLLAMADDPAGREVLRSYEETAKFDRFPQGPEQALAEVSELLSFVEEDFGLLAEGRDGGGPAQGAE